MWIAVNQPLQFGQARRWKRAMVRLRINITALVDPQRLRPAA
jgi:hypothetical protein